MFHPRWLLIAENAVAEQAAGGSPLSRLDDMGRLRLAASWALLLLAIAGLLLIVAYMMRMWRRAVRRPLPPIKMDEDAWARRPLTPPDEEE